MRLMLDSRIFERVSCMLKSGQETTDNCVQETSYVQLQNGPEPKIEQESVKPDLELRLIPQSKQSLPIINLSLLSQNDLRSSFGDAAG